MFLVSSEAALLNSFIGLQKAEFWANRNAPLDSAAGLGDTDVISTSLLSLCSSLNGSLIILAIFSLDFSSVTLYLPNKSCLVTVFRSLKVVDWGKYRMQSAKPFLSMKLTKNA